MKNCLGGDIILKINGYPIIYCPERDDTIGNSGCVYVHVLMAEKLLGRKLKNGEIIHHKDHNRENFSEDNLIVFKSQADHARFHLTGNLEKQGDVYISRKIKNKCIDCGKTIGNKNKRCKSCYKKYKSKGYADIILENKETIYSMAQKGCSVKEIADYFNMAPQSFSRICRRLGIKYKI